MLKSGKLILLRVFILILICLPANAEKKLSATNTIRQRILINDNWHFYKYESASKADTLRYDVRPALIAEQDDKVADSKPTEAIKVESSGNTLKPWIMPTGNDFISDPKKKYIRPQGNPGYNFQFVQYNYDDNSWEKINLPHDWAIKGPFITGDNAEVGGGMGRLPSPGVAWYRKKLDIPASDADKILYLDVDGAMSYAMVWLNGHLVGGWPYGYASWRVNLTPYLKFGGKNQLAIRLDNPPASARWYPGGGIYRNVWLTKVNPIHVGQWGTTITTTNVSKTSATINLKIAIDNEGKKSGTINTVTHIYALNARGEKIGKVVTAIRTDNIDLNAGKKIILNGTTTIDNPRLWGPKPTQTPNLYVAETILFHNGKQIDTYNTEFGIRSLTFDSQQGILVNNERIPIRGVNQHHDLGALGAAFNLRATERQLEILQEMGCNAIRLSHNPPSPELLELTDRMGILVMDEIFDVWERKKTPLDFHLIFPEWFEQDTRAFIRRDRNHASIIMWSFGNEVGEQYTAEEGAKIAKRLHDIVGEEDATRPSTASMNYAKPDMPFPQALDVISLNYQGEGIRDAPAYSTLNGIRTSPLYTAFHEKFPEKVILSSETASALSSRGTYLFPVFEGFSAPIKDGFGGDP
jgi:beta-galactosidase